MKIACQLLWKSIVPTLSWQSKIYTNGCWLQAPSSSRGPQAQSAMLASIRSTDQSTNQPIPITRILSPVLCASQLCEFVSAPSNQYFRCESWQHGIAPRKDSGQKLWIHDLSPCIWTHKHLWACAMLQIWTKIPAGIIPGWLAAEGSMPQSMQFWIGSPWFGGMAAARAIR